MSIAGVWRSCRTCRARFRSASGLAVAPDHQRRGVGRMLVEVSESMLVARGVDVVVVTSGDQRADAHAFYEKNGYAPWSPVQEARDTVGVGLAEDARRRRLDAAWARTGSE
ncbi:MAG: GNAT family N-acetyltransferase [Gemmatimonadaceae bacterium]|nr:GNAT family N-acetyltransferase [Gemmatimonadaceae bacterium]